MFINSTLKKIAVLMIALPIISLSAANSTIARGEREGGGFNREGGEHRQSGEFNREGEGQRQGGEFNREGQGGQQRQNYSEGANVYNRNVQENYNKNYNDNRGYSGQYGNAGSAARGYTRGYEQGVNSGSGSGTVYYQTPTPMYVAPQQPYNTEPPVNQNQPYQYQYPN